MAGGPSGGSERPAGGDSSAAHRLIRAPTDLLRSVPPDRQERWLSDLLRSLPPNRRERWRGDLLHSLPPGERWRGDLPSLNSARPADGDGALLRDRASSDLLTFSRLAA